MVNLMLCLPTVVDAIGVYIVISMLVLHSGDQGSSPNHITNSEL